jgi:predicted acyl esterase
MPRNEPWRLDAAPARLRRTVRRIRFAVAPLATVVDPPAGIAIERDVGVAVRDGTVLRLDVHRPAPAGRQSDPAAPRVPVLLCAHPYGKATRPRRRRRGWSVPGQFRMLTQSEPFSVSALASWEAPDPGFWVPRGYAVVNLDLRGWGASGGTGELFSEQEGRDIHDVIEWLAAQPWCDGQVAMTGVSYLAISQWAAAAERPPHLVAINPWEGLTDLYRDLARPGGIREDGFVLLWSTLLKRQRRSPVTIRSEAAARPLIDDWWRARSRDLEAIEVPALVGASFSDHCLHSRGSFEGYRRIGSARRYLYTHRSPKWAAYYAGPGRDAQVAFFDQLLLGRDTGLDDEPPVRVEIRSDGSTVAEIRRAHEWPPREVTWEAQHLDASPLPSPDDPRAGDRGRLGPEAPATAAHGSFSGRHGVRFVRRFDETTDVVGPMWVRLPVEVVGGPDAHVFVGLDHVRAGRRLGYEGSYGFGDDLLSHGMRRVVLRGTDPVPVPDPGSAPGRPPWHPGHPDTVAEPIRAGAIEPLDLELHAAATRFLPGDELHLIVQGRWFFPTNPLTGQVPARYERGPDVTVRLHTGGEHDAVLHLPIWPRPTPPPAMPGRG